MSCGLAMARDNDLLTPLRCSNQLGSVILELGNGHMASHGISLSGQKLAYSGQNVHHPVRNAWVIGYRRSRPKFLDPSLTPGGA